MLGYLQVTNIDTYIYIDTDDGDLGPGYESVRCPAYTTHPNIADPISC